MPPENEQQNQRQQQSSNAAANEPRSPQQIARLPAPPYDVNSDPSSNTQSEIEDDNSHLLPIVSRATSRQGIKQDVLLLLSRISQARRDSYRGFAIVTDRFYFYNVSGDPVFSVALRGGPEAGMYHMEGNSGSRIYLNTETELFEARSGLVGFDQDTEERASGRDSDDGYAHIYFEDWLDLDSNSEARTILNSHFPCILSVSNGAGRQVSTERNNEEIPEDQEFSTEAQLAAWPMDFYGPKTVVTGANSTFTSSINQQAFSESFSEAVFDEMVSIRYSYELIDMTVPYRNFQRQESERLERERQDSTDNVLAIPTINQFEDSRAFEEGSENEGTEVTQLARTEHNLEQANSRLEEQNMRAFEDSLNGSGTGMFNLITSGIGEIGNLGGALIDVVTEVRETYADTRTIPIPDQPNKHYLVRCIAQPVDGNRAPSIAGHMIHVQSNKQAGEDALDRQTIELENRREILVALMLQENNDDRREELQRSIDEIDQALGRSGSQELEFQLGMRSRIQNSLNRMREQFLNVRPNSREESGLIADIAVLERQLSQINPEAEGNLRIRLDMARDRAEDYGDNCTYYRPRAAFVSEETGNTTNLLLDIVNIGTLTNPEIRLSDLSTDMGIETEGTGTTLRDAVDNAFVNYSEQAPYGPGHLTLRAPANFPGGFARSQYRCLAHGGVLALERLEQVGRIGGAVIAFVGSGGTASVIVGMAAAIPSVVRLYERAQNHNLRFDAAAVGDVINVLTAAASGVQALGEIRVVNRGGMVNFVHRSLLPVAERAGRLASTLDRVSFLQANVWVIYQINQIQQQVELGLMNEIEGRRRITSIIANAISDLSIQLIQHSNSNVANNRRLLEALNSSDTQGHETQADVHRDAIVPPAPETEIPAFVDDNIGHRDAIVPPAPETEIPAFIDDIGTRDTLVDDLGTRETIVDDLGTRDTVVDDPDTRDTIVDDIETRDTIVDDVEARDTIVDDIDTRDTVVNDLDTRDTIVNDVDTRDTIVDDIETRDTILDRDTIVDDMYPSSPAHLDIPDSPIVHMVDSLDPYNDTPMESSGNSGSIGDMTGGGVFSKRIRLADGRVILAAIKVYPPTNRGSSTLGQFESDLRGAYAAQTTEMGIEIYGPVHVEGFLDHHAYAMEIAEGGFVNNESLQASDSPSYQAAESEAASNAQNVNDYTFETLDLYSHALLRNGYYYEGECQGFVGADGRFIPIDFSGISVLPQTSTERENAIQAHFSNIDVITRELRP